MYISKPEIIAIAVLSCLLFVGASMNYIRRVQGTASISVKRGFLEEELTLKYHQRRKCPWLEYHIKALPLAIWRQKRLSSYRENNGEKTQKSWNTWPTFAKTSRDGRGYTTARNKTKKIHYPC